MTPKKSSKIDWDSLYPSVHENNNHQIYFDSNDIKEKRYYIAWVDIMGTAQKLAISLSVGGNFICKLHMCAKKCKNDLCELSGHNKELILYPIVDGMYVASDDLKVMKKFLSILFDRLASIFISERKFYHKFIIRAAISYGIMALGNNIVSGIDDDIKPFILLGKPLYDANSSESNAAPFGIFIHESARRASFKTVSDDSKEGFESAWWRWFLEKPLKEKSKIKDELKNKLDEYFNLCLEEYFELGLDKTKVLIYKDLIKQYFKE